VIFVLALVLACGLGFILLKREWSLSVCELFQARNSFIGKTISMDAIVSIGPKMAARRYHVFDERCVRWNFEVEADPSIKPAWDELIRSTPQPTDWRDHSFGYRAKLRGRILQHAIVQKDSAKHPPAHIYFQVESLEVTSTVPFGDPIIKEWDRRYGSETELEEWMKDFCKRKGRVFDSVGLGECR